MLPILMNSMLRRFSAARFACIASSVVLFGCAVPPQQPVVVPKISISAKLPVVSAMVDGNGSDTQSGARRTPEAQEKGGIEIAVVPATYATTTKQKYAVTPKSAGFGNMLGAAVATGGKAQNLVYVEETVTPFLDVSPARLQFTVRVNNKLARVFRGQGAVVQINVAGKLLPFGQTDYSEFLNGIVPPRNENTFTILGPRIDTLPDKASIGIFLYDVVTATDVAGNTTERQNYEWYFNYSVKTVETQAELRQGERFMEPGEYQRAVILARKRSMDDPDTPPFLAPH